MSEYPLPCGGLIVQGTALFSMRCGTLNKLYNTVYAVFEVVTGVITILGEWYVWHDGSCGRGRG